MSTISFIVDPNLSSADAPEDTTETRSHDRTKGVFGSDGSQAEAVLAQVSAESLRGNLTRASQGILQLLSDIRKIGAFRLKEVQLQVEISAEGGVQFIGTSKIGGKGAITLTFGSDACPDDEPS